MRNVRFLSFGWLLALSLATVFFYSCREEDNSIAVTGISLDVPDLSLAIGKNYTLKATVTPDDATDKAVKWTSSDNAKATVDDKGKVTAVAAGTATITAKAGGKTATCIVTVSAVDVTGISLNKTTLALNSGGVSQRLIATITPSNATGKTVTWTSSNNSIASVYSDGSVISGFTAGTATITAKAGDKTATCIVTVSAPVMVQSISLDKSEITIITGKSETLVATVDPSDTPITWTSNNTALATVSDGKVTASWTNYGTAIITAKAGNKTTTCTVNVILDPALSEDEGVVIDGIKWATRNVHSPGTFAATSSSEGLLYQWNRKTGWNTTEMMIGGTFQDPYRKWPTGVSIASEWESSNNPCPKGWRLPTRQELESLSEYFIEKKGVLYVFGSGDATISLPARSYRADSNQGLLLTGEGRYWSSEQAGSDYIYAYDLWLAYGMPDIGYTSKATGACIRCVAEQE